MQARRGGWGTTPLAFVRGRVFPLVDRHLIRARVQRGISDQSGTHRSCSVAPSWSAPLDPGTDQRITSRVPGSAARCRLGRHETAPAHPRPGNEARDAALTDAELALHVAPAALGVAELTLEVLHAVPRVAARPRDRELLADLHHVPSDTNLVPFGLRARSPTVASADRGGRRRREARLNARLVRAGDLVDAADVRARHAHVDATAREVHAPV